MDAENENSDLLLRLKLGIIGGIVGPLLLAVFPGAFFLVQPVYDLMPQEDGFVGDITMIALWLLGVVLGGVIFTLM